MEKTNETVCTKKKESKRDVVYKASAGIANAILVTLGVGLLCQTIGKFSGLQAFTGIGTVAIALLSPALGVGMAYELKCNTLVIFSAMIAAAIGGNSIHIVKAGVVFSSGQPISAILAGVIAICVGKFVMGKTKLDMMAIPFCAVVIGGISGIGLAAVITPALNWVSGEIAYSVQVSPFLGSALVALVWSILLVSPASSVAIAIALKLDPISSAAALIGCTAQFIGVTLISFKENDPGANIAQGIITPKVQLPNIIENPKIMIPSLVAGTVSAPIATALFGFKASYTIAGLGLNSFIAPLTISSTQGVKGLLIYVVTGIIIPATIAVPISMFMKKSGYIKSGDMQLKIQ